MANKNSPPNSDIRPFSSPSASKKAKIIQNIRDTLTATNSIPPFINYIPLLNTTNSNNYAEILVKFSHDCSHHIPLDEFLNYIFKSFVSENVDHFDEHLTLESSSPLCLESLKLCHILLRNFRSPTIIGASSDEKSINNLKLLSINFDQIIRTFVAIKIIFDSIRVVCDKKIENSIPRTSLYKAYYIICQNYIQSSPNVAQKKYPVIGQSLFGKLLKLIHPDISMKRIGSRGKSIYHYTGVQWNECVIDADVKRLMDLTLPDLELYFKNRKFKKAGEKSNYPLKTLTPEPLSNKSDCLKSVDPLISLPKLSTRKPLHSFVNFASTLPNSDFLPCSWNEGKQSKSGKEKIKKSVEALKDMNVDIEPLIETFDIDMFYQESNVSFFDDVIQIIHLLFDRGLSGEAYLHLYLVVSLLIFPATLSPEKEGSNIVQIRLCKYLDIFLARLESEFIGLPSSDFCNLMCFSNIMKEMSNLNRLLVIRINTNLTKQVVKVMVDDVQSFTVDNQPKMSEIIYTAVIRGVNAFNWGDFDSSFKDSPEFQSTIKNLVEQFLKLCIAISGDVASIPESMDNEDFQNPTYNLCFRIFKILVKNFFEIFLSDTSILLPVRLISFIFMDMSNDIHNLSFNDFTGRDHDVSKESFKNWWMFSAIVQTFIAILAEITALSALLD